MTERTGAPWPAIALAAVLGTWQLGTESLWADEAFSAAMAQMDWGSFASLVGDREVNMVLYNLALRPWSALGASEAWLRLPSVVFMCLAIVVLHRVALRLVGPTTASLSTFIFVLNGFVVEQMQESRAGALAVLVSCVSTLLVLRLLDHPSTTRTVAYATVVGLGAYVHFFTVLVFLAHVPVLALERRRIPRRSLLVGGATMAILLAPVVAYVLLGAKPQADWIPPTSPSTLWKAWFDLTGGGGRILSVGFLALIGVAGVHGVRSRRLASGLRRDAVVLWAWLVVPLVVALAVSLARPLVVARYFVVVLPAVSIVAAIGLRALPRSWMRVLGTAGLLLLGARSVWLWHDVDHKEDWRALTATVLANAGPGDALVAFEDSGRAPIDYYVAETEAGGFVPSSARGEPPWGTWEAISVIERDPETRTAELLSHFDRIWIAAREEPADRLSSDTDAWEVRRWRFERLHLLLVAPVP